MRLNENALAAIKATGVSMGDFKLRQEFVEALKTPNHWMTAATLEDWDTSVDSIAEMRAKIMDEMYESTLNELLGEKMQQKILPVTMEINGEKKKVGEAIIEARGESYCIVHAVIDGEEEVAALLKTDLNQISIGNRDDFKKED